jgi:hypothetical protein
MQMQLSRYEAPPVELEPAGQAMTTEFSQYLFTGHDEHEILDGSLVLTIGE